MSKSTNIGNTILGKTLELSKTLLSFPTVTPEDAGCLQYIADYLAKLGFEIQWHNKENIKNLYAKRYVSADKPFICFAGHTDVVPTGDGWANPPFQPTVLKDKLYARGTSDMKCAIACFITALEEINNSGEGLGNKNISILLTSDEEADAINGLRTMIDFLSKEKIDLFVLGEPTAMEYAGDCVKIGRRGSVTGVLTCYGQQGHIAYPQHFDNPITTIMKTYQALQDAIDKTDIFPFGPTRMELTNMESPNTGENVVPANATMRFGIRFNTTYTTHTLKELIMNICQQHAKEHNLQLSLHGNPFITKDPKVLDWLKETIGENVVFDAKGATSDGRFLSSIAPVIECGFLENQAHQIDENVSLEDLDRLTKIYISMINKLHQLPLFDTSLFDTSIISN